jgi:hypothetical protein
VRIIAFTTSWWSSPEEAQAKAEGLFGLHACRDRAVALFKPFWFFVAAGTWSEPEWSPLGIDVPVVNAGATLDRPYEPIYWNYGGCAITAACAYLANRRDWDIAVCVDTDTLYGAVDWDAVLREFLARPDELLADDWWGRPGYVVAWKPAAVSRYLHQRLRPNLLERGYPDEALPMLLEDEFGAMFAGRIFNPWPNLRTTRQDAGLDSEQYVARRAPLDEHWPFVRLPSPQIVEEYLRDESSRAKPVLAP